jgi:hypothetical protein
VLSAVPIAIITNAARVSGTGVLSHYYGTRVADGFFHEFSGWIVYVVAFLMLFGLGWALDLFGGRKGRAKKARAAELAGARGGAPDEAKQIEPADGPASVVGS